MGDVLSDELNEERKAKQRLEQEEQIRHLLERGEMPEMPKDCEKYNRKLIGCQSEEIILAGFERSGILWTANNLKIITSHYTCEVSTTIRT